jgi:phosphoribosylglycinamide formyltransferase-1
MPMAASWTITSRDCICPHDLREVDGRAATRVTMRRRLAVLASHEGTTLQAVLDACANPAFPWEVVLVISNNADSGALRRARTAGVPAGHLSSRTHEAPEALDRAMCQALCDARAELVLLAGYMKKLGPVTLGAFRDRIVNTHPALLPKFGGQGMYGLHVHRAVLAARERTTGASVHLVDAGYDTGPVVAQVEVPVEPADTAESLAARVQARERELVVEVLARIPATGLPGSGMWRLRGEA